MCFDWHWSFSFFRDYIGIYVKMFCNTTEDKSFILRADSDGLLLMRSENQKIKLLQDSKLRSVLDMIFWIFDVSFTKIQRIIITTTLIIVTILIIGVWGWLNKKKSMSPFWFFVKIKFFDFFFQFYVLGTVSYKNSLFRNMIYTTGLEVTVEIWHDFYYWPCDFWFVIHEIRPKKNIFSHGLKVYDIRR